MMPSRIPTAAPPAGPLACSRVDFRGDIYAFRPGGTRDWLLAYTEAGSGRFEHGGKRLLTKPGDIVLIRPGTPHDYGVHLKAGRWKNTWVHFIPRSDVLSWMSWPECFPGHFLLQLEGRIRHAVERALRELYKFHTGAHWRQAELAMNALEQGLLFCDQANPRHAETRRDPRILRSAEEMSRRRSEKMSIRDLARQAGLSRSRYVQLFHREMGLPPRDYMEQQRLLRARELLEYSTLGISQIADEVGFDCPFYFSNRFRKQFGLSPKAFRQKKTIPFRK